MQLVVGKQSAGKDCQVFSAIGIAQAFTRAIGAVVAAIHANARGLGKLVVIPYVRTDPNGVVVDTVLLASRQSTITIAFKAEINLATVGRTIGALLIVMVMPAHDFCHVHAQLAIA